SDAGGSAAMPSTHSTGVAQLLKSRKRLVFAACDVASVLIANVLAVALRFDFDWSSFRVRNYRNVELALLDLLLTPTIFYLSGLYQGYWKYAGLDDLIRLVRAIATRTAALI